MNFLAATTVEVFSSYSNCFSQVKCVTENSKNFVEKMLNDYNIDDLDIIRVFLQFRPVDDKPNLMHALIFLDLNKAKEVILEFGIDGLNICLSEDSRHEIVEEREIKLQKPINFKKLTDLSFVLANQKYNIVHYNCFNFCERLLNEFQDCFVSNDHFKLLQKKTMKNIFNAFF